MRETADYDIQFKIPAQDKTLSIRKAERIIDECTKELPSSEQSDA